ncbi:hypothetical protein M1L60_11285 [Actinoplanes sp. TRM 88003]|uniref:LSDAT prokaryote domain-containing protein n=1 Tax=Paractinoplanes aksuensis TaxID=2939490 RepID=A0ABT1DM67_9ACTN|nr:hypothetical protein [Actinoplanes aksuensis]MCO8271176.1 hypothetical protein [Actinoplanes aksuensis]
MSTLVRLPGGGTAVAAYVSGLGAVPAAVASFGLPAPSPVLVVIGGAGGLTDEVAASLSAVFTRVVAPAVRRHHAIAVDGGTDSGVMRLLGRALGGDSPLVGVTALDTAVFPGHPGSPIADAVPLEDHHTHFVLVDPGHEWGDEAPYIAAAATALAAGAPSLTVLVNGGEITVDDARHSLAEGRPVLVLAGTGRTADAIAAAAADPASCRDERLVALATSPFVRAIAVTDEAVLAARIAELLRP